MPRKTQINRFCFVLFSFVLIGELFISCGTQESWVEAGQTAKVSFFLPSDATAGQYHFDFDNGPGSSKQFCFCLTENNTFPPDCRGNVISVTKYGSNEKLVPARIGTGECNVKPIDCGAYASTLYQLADNPEAKNNKDGITIEIKVPETCKKGDRLVIQINWYLINEEKTDDNKASEIKILKVK